MKWFEYLPRTFTDLASLSASYIKPPLRHSINIYKPYSEISENQLIAVDISSVNFESSSNFLTIISSLSSKIQDKKQYIVVHHDSDTDDHTPVKSTVIGNYLYFLSAKNHEAGEDIVDQYALYYGNDHLKYVEQVTYQLKTKYRQISTVNKTLMVNNPSMYDTEPYNLDISLTNSVFLSYFTTVDAKQESPNESSWSYYNESTDWANYQSSYVGAKVSGSFTGPYLEINAYKKPNGGKIKLKIVKEKSNLYTPDLDILPTDPPIIPEEIFLDWTEIDLYNVSSTSATIYSSQIMEKYKYNFTIEVIDQDNKSSSGKEVELISYKYLKTFDCNFLSKEYNPELSFKE
jgi:hypothetical protein